MKNSVILTILGLQGQFVKKTTTGCIILIAYVDDIIITSSGIKGIAKIKVTSELQIKDLGHLKYFSGIEMPRKEKGILLCQKKDVMDMLKECGILGAKPAETPLETSRKLEPNAGEPLKINQGIED